MKNPVTVEDAIALINRTSLPTVITEGSDDYRVMRRIEERLSDIGVDFLPLGGKGNVLEVWGGIDDRARSKCMAIVDLDLWIFSGIPTEYHHESIIFTSGYSIENDLYIDANLINLLETDEKNRFNVDLRIVAAWYTREVCKALRDEPFCISDHPNKVLQDADITSDLSHEEEQLFNNILIYFGQTLRGKTLFELLTRQLSRPGRFVKFGHKHLYELASVNIGNIFGETETRIRSYF